MDFKERMNYFDEAQNLSKEIGEFISSKPDMSFGLAISALSMILVKSAQAAGMGKDEMIKLFGLTLEVCEDRKKSDQLMDRFFESSEKTSKE